MEGLIQSTVKDGCNEGDNPARRIRYNQISIIKIRYLRFTALTVRCASPAYVRQLNCSWCFLQVQCAIHKEVGRPYYILQLEIYVEQTLDDIVHRISESSIPYTLCLKSCDQRNRTSVAPNTLPTIAAGRHPGKTALSRARRISYGPPEAFYRTQ